MEEVGMQPRALRLDLLKMPIGPGERPVEGGSPPVVRLDELSLSRAAAGYDISPEGRRDMDQLARVAERRAGGKPALGWCYREVWGHLMEAGYGKLQQDSIPDAYSRYARQFGEYLNQGGNARRLGLQRLPIDNPYEAPRGAIVVVRPGTPGTAHPVAGDITVAMGKGRFLNDGEMGYGGSSYFPPGNPHVIGIYAPL